MGKQNNFLGVNPDALDKPVGFANVESKSAQTLEAHIRREGQNLASEGASHDAGASAPTNNATPEVAGLSKEIKSQLINAQQAESLRNR